MHPGVFVKFCKRTFPMNFQILYVFVIRWSMFFQLNRFLKKVFPQKINFEDLRFKNCVGYGQVKLILNIFGGSRKFLSQNPALRTGIQSEFLIMYFGTSEGRAIFRLLLRGERAHTFKWKFYVSELSYCERSEKNF